MRAEPSHALIYVDLSSAEFGIAGALSHDSSMMEDNRQGPLLITYLEKSRSVYCACVGSAPVR